MKIYIQFQIARITFFDRYINYNAIKCLMTPNIYISVIDNHHCSIRSTCEQLLLKKSLTRWSWSAKIHFQLRRSRESWDRSIRADETYTARLMKRRKWRSSWLGISVFSIELVEYHELLLVDFGLLYVN